MAHHIGVAFLGEEAAVAPVLSAVLDKKIIAPSSLYMPKSYEKFCPEAAAAGAQFCPSADAVVVNAEVLVVAATKKTFDLVLAPISGCTTGRIILAISDDKRIDCAHVQDRVARGAYVVAAPTQLDENGVRYVTPEFAKNFPSWMKQPCLDILAALCELRMDS